MGLPLIGTLAGIGSGLLNYFSAKKPIQPGQLSWEGPGSLLDVPGASDLSKRLTQRAQLYTPDYWKDKYYNEVYQPTADLTRSNWEGYVAPEISSSMSSRGLGRSTLAGELLRRSVQEREMGLGQYAGQLKAQGLDTGLKAEDTALGDWSDFINNDYTARLNAANQGMNAQKFNIPGNYEYANNLVKYNNRGWDAASEAIGTMGNVGTMSGGGGGGGISNLLSQLMSRQHDLAYRTQRQNPALSDIYNTTGSGLKYDWASNTRSPYAGY